MFQRVLYSNFTGQNKFGQSISLSELLDNPQTTLLRLLDEETFASQFKVGAQRVKDFMNYDRFIELIEMVTVVGNQSDKKRGYKFPLVACELLVSDNTKIQEYFLPTTGSVTIEEKVTKSEQRLVEQQVEDDDEGDQNDEISKSSQKKQDTTDQSIQKAGESIQKVEGESVEVDKTLSFQTEKKEQQKKDQDEFGEFVQAPPKTKKTVMIKQVVETTQIIKKQYPPLLNKLLSYFTMPINHTLTGYVCKILIAFTNKKNNILFSQLFQTEAETDNLFGHVFTHIGSRSTVEWLTRIFTIQNKNYLDQRFQLLHKLVKYLGGNEEIEDLSNIAACIIQTYEKITAYLKTVNPIKQLEIYNNRVVQIMKTVVAILLTDKQPAATYATQIFSHLISIFPISQQSEQLSSLLSPFIKGAINYLKKLLSEEYQRVGLMGLKLMQILNSLLRSWRVNQWFSDKDNENIFPILLALVRKYSCNNIFHNEIFKFIKACLTSPVEELVQLVVNKGTILEWLEEESTLMQAHLQTKSTKPRNGYGEHIVFLCKYLKESASANNQISQLVKKQIFTNIWKKLVDRQVSSCQKLLGGLAKKQTVHKIMYSKESILAAHATFLASAPIVVPEKDMNDPLQNELLLQELKRQLDGIEDIVQSRPQQVIEEQIHKAELIEENDHHKNAFWKVHLDYNVDHLLEDLA